MGKAATVRGDRAIAREVDRMIEASRATNEARALLYRDVLSRGCVLTFKANDGAAVTAGPYQRAAGGGIFAGFRYGGRFAGEHEGSAWGTALWLVEQIGRKRPVRVTCPGGR